MSKKYEELKKKEEELITKRMDYYEKNLPYNRKSGTATCPNCASKINTTYLKSYNCPVCRQKFAFMSETVQETLRRYSERSEILHKQLVEEERKEKSSHSAQSPCDAFAEGCKRVEEELEIIYDVVNTPDYREYKGDTGGDVRCIRVYKNGTVCEK